MPPALAARYHAEGWWDDDTLPAFVARSLRAAAGCACCVYSTTRPYRGTIGDVADGARRLASALRAHGIGPGDVVAFQLPNWVEAAITFWGAALTGAVLVPVVHIYGPKELGFVLEQVGARALVTASRFGSIDYLAALDAHRRRVPSLELVATVDGTTDASVPFESLLDGQPIDRVPALDPDAPAVVGFTSGTTADPKGVVHSHRTLLAEVRQLEQLQPPAGTNPVLLASPVSHATGMLGGLLMPIAGDRSIRLLDRWDPQHVLRVVVEENLSSGGGATYFLTSLLDAPGFGDEHLARIRHVSLGGAPIPRAVTERADRLGISVIRTYGSTEHPSTTAGRHDDPRDERLGSDGRPMAGVEVRTVDENGAPLGPGEAGELQSRGPDLFVGYTDPALTAAAIDADGWYATGDVAVVDDAGYVTIVDRVKDVIIRGGENISAAEVEELLTRMAAVAEVAVVAAPDARLGEHVCAFVRTRAGAAPPALDDVRAHLAAAGLARQKWPEELRIVDDFARTPSGKVKKFVLRELARDQRAPSVS